MAWDGASLRVVKLPSTPPDFERAVVNAAINVIGQITTDQSAIVHGSTVATNALLERRGQKIAFITTDGFSDMLLIGRQNRPQLYALHPQRFQPIVDEENCFSVRERIAADGAVVEPLELADVDRVIDEIAAKQIRHVAVCLLFSFVNPSHEQAIAQRCRAAGLITTISSDVLREFREYERASTTAINAFLRPTVEKYLGNLESRLGESTALKIMHSGGGTISVSDAIANSGRLILSGPAGGVIGAAHVARLAGFKNVITYDMGGTSTDVATVIDGEARWTTSTTIDGLPIALTMFDIHTIGAGGGSIARLDEGGALRVGPQSAGANPGPACYGRGGNLPTVTDANVVLWRIPADALLGNAIKLDLDAAHKAIEPLARKMNCSIREAASGVLRVVESNMAAAVRFVTSRRGLDPRDFALLSFGGAGGLHACAVAEQLEIPRVIVPPHCGVLSALGMVVAPPIVDSSRTVLHLRDSLDDVRLEAEFGSLGKSDQRFADVRFVGQSHEVTVKVADATRAAIEREFTAVYRRMYGAIPSGTAIEIVTLRARSLGRGADLQLPKLSERDSRFALIGNRRAGPMTIVDPDATTWLPNGWTAVAEERGIITLEREK